MNFSDYFVYNASFYRTKFGQSSSLKMMRSIIIKGIESLTRGSDDLNWLRPSDHNLERTGSQGIRHVADTRQVVANIADVSLPAGMARSTSEW